MNAQRDGHYTEHSFWLLPAEPINATLHSIIRQLAKRFYAIEFNPHVTISCGASNDDETISIAREIAGRFSPLKLTPAKLDHTRTYTKTLFVQFQESETARQMSGMVKDRSAKPKNYVLNPHLSLLYKTMPPTEQAELCQSLEVPQGPYQFDRLRIIETEIPLAKPEQIKRWLTVFECALKGSGKLPLA